MGQESPIRAVIGVSYGRNHSSGELETFYVLRSESMENYPDTWSLPSIQYAPGELPDPLDLAAASEIFDRLSAERFTETPMTVKRYLTEGKSDQNPMGRMVELVLYEISFPRMHGLNSEFYTDSAWLTEPEINKKNLISPHPCGLCTHLWNNFVRDHADQL